MSLNFIISPFTADTAKEFPPEKKATERFRISPSLHKVSLVISMASINKPTNINLHLRVDAIHVIGYNVTIVLSKWNIRQEQCPMKTEEKTLTMEGPFLKRGKVAA